VFRCTTYGAQAVCLLLRYGANLDHIGTMSWTPLFYCWPWVKASQVPMSNFISAMAQSDDMEVDVTDKWGWAVIHRAAAFGTGEDVEVLISLGASIHAYTLPLRWDAIVYAVEYGNFDTFSVLVRHLDSINITKAIDERGWTLLHIAASAGHDQIVRHILSLGADPYALSKPFMSHMPEFLFHRRCTPEDVAKAQSAERRDRYLQAVRGVALINPVSIVATADEIFYDALEQPRF
jgi:ankyrin repeat protein